MILKVTEKIVKLLSLFCMIAIIGLTVIVATQVITRLMNVSLPWTEELARFFLIWLTFLGSSLALQKKMHLSVNYFVNLVSKKLRLVIGLLIHGIMIAFFCTLVINGFKLSILSIATISPALQWSMGLVYSVLPISSIISTYFVVINMLDFVKKGGTLI